MELSSFGLLFRLIFAHFLADFILQSKGMANGKRGFQRKDGLVLFTSGHIISLTA